MYIFFRHVLAVNYSTVFFVLKCAILFPQANATDDGQYVFFTGETNYTDFARVDAWKNER